MNPDTLEVPLPPFVEAGEARLLLAVKLYEMARLSLGQAAALCGRSRAGFIDELGHLGVPVLDTDPEELAGELQW